MSPTGCDVGDPFSVLANSFLGTLKSASAPRTFPFFWLSDLSPSPHKLACPDCPFHCIPCWWVTCNPCCLISSFSALTYSSPRNSLFLSVSLTSLRLRVPTHASPSPAQFLSVSRLTPPSVVPSCGYPMLTCFLLGIWLIPLSTFLATCSLGVITFPSLVLQLVSIPNKHASLDDPTCLSPWTKSHRLLIQDRCDTAL